MKNDELTEMMTFKRQGDLHIPLFVIPVNGKYIIAAYQGTLSEYDILIKYRQKQNGSWSRIRTPKHIHWAVDILLKMHSEKDKTRQFLEKLIEVWSATLPIRAESDRKAIFSIESLLNNCRNEFTEYQALSSKGEYTINFLILLAKLLMVQEKTNLESAYMFRNLLEALRDGEDIFKIVSIATHR